MTTAQRPGARYGAALGLAAAALSLTVGVSSCATTAVSTRATRAAPSGTAEVLLTFEDSPGTQSMVTGPRNLGSASSSVSVSTSDGGRVIADLGPDGLAGRFPAAGGPARPRAAVVVVPTGPDALAPAAGDFSYGADVILDRASEDAGDNGDNVLQRGLYAGTGQYKLQLDHGRPSCRVAGDDGAAFVEAAAKVVREEWYRIVCARRGDELLLSVRRWDGAAWAAEQTWSAPARIGVVSFAPEDGAAVVPLTVGAKVGADGRIPADASDQLNGAVDNVFVDLAEVGP